MRETQEDLRTLQSTIDATYLASGPHLLSIHTEQRRLSAAEVCDELQGVCVLNLATVSRASAPVVAPIDGLFLRGRFWFGSAPNSLRFKHIRANPQVSAAYTLGERVSIVVHGHAHEIDTSSGNYEELRSYCQEIYGAAFDSWGYWGTYPYAWIEAKRFYAVRISD